MYATCLFCNQSLGANESIEHFPVGRRLAFDNQTGRLWVVCRRCERWNLSPIETRWEAIEEAERAYRGTRLRASTDNIGLAQLGDGTELVRIGKPPETEFAAWRYGDQFGRRRRRYAAYTALPLLGIFAQSASFLMPDLLERFSGALPDAVRVTGVAVGLAMAVSVRAFQQRLAAPKVALHDDGGNLMQVTQSNVNAAVLSGVQGSDDVVLRIPHVDVKRAPFIDRHLGATVVPAVVHPAVTLTGATAMRALATLLPHVNEGGGTEREVREAVAVVSESHDVATLVQRTATFAAPVRRLGKTRQLPLRFIAPPIRLALEMSLHSDDERRAMDGELHELEQRWREADEIAKIADAMFSSAAVSERVDALRRRNHAP